ncbi:hypothetical protein BHE74_00041026 [Ensete ventricosum]|nr:hypothetical protein BHE74_00041026 [Ensete ventricosum]
MCNGKRCCFREKVVIPKEKQYIFLRGNGKGRTAIVWDESSANNTLSATFTVWADNFIAFGISFKVVFPDPHHLEKISPHALLFTFYRSVHRRQNDALIAIADAPHNQSVATMVAGDKVAFYHCAFYSPHNTLFDYKGRHYYESSYIQGNIDFIFGRGQSIFQESVCSFRLTRGACDTIVQLSLVSSINECRVVRYLCCTTRESRSSAPSPLRTGSLRMTAAALSSSKARCTEWETCFLVEQRGLTLVSSSPKLISPGPSQLRGGRIGVTMAAQSKRSHRILLVPVTEWRMLMILAYVYSLLQQFTVRRVRVPRSGEQLDSSSSLVEATRRRRGFTSHHHRLHRWQGMVTCILLELLLLLRRSTVCNKALSVAIAMVWLY